MYMGKTVSLAGERREWHATLSYENIFALWKVGLREESIGCISVHRI
jgi:hypothetical protein